jgi:hypothetical protein
VSELLPLRGRARGGPKTSRFAHVPEESLRRTGQVALTQPSAVHLETAGLDPACSNMTRAAGGSRARIAITASFDSHTFVPLPDSSLVGSRVMSALAMQPQVERLRQREG